jgi:hypothetical protein
VIFVQNDDRGVHLRRVLYRFEQIFFDREKEGGVRLRPSEQVLFNELFPEILFYPPFTHIESI